MSSDQRREQILDAVLDVTLERGLAVTSKELAAAAGVAEGTLYKAFGDKESLLRALVAREGRREDAAGQWIRAGGAESATLEELAAGIAELAILQYRQQFRMLQMLGSLMQQPSHEDIAEFDRMLEPWIDALDAHRDRLGIATARAAAMLRMLVIAACHDGGWGIPMTPAEIVHVFLHGVASRAHAPAAPAVAA